MRRYAPILLLLPILLLVWLATPKAEPVAEPFFGSDSGALSPGTLADDATVGTVAWTDPSNAASSNNSYAVAGGGDFTSHYLKATNFGFSIPSTATINGITVAIERKKETFLNVNDSQVKIVKADGSIGTTNKADTGTNWPTSDGTATYGGVSDVWGETWTATDINDADFGVVLSVTHDPNPDGSNASVDHITITVTYTEAVAGNQVQVNGGTVRVDGGTVIVR